MSGMSRFDRFFEHRNGQEASETPSPKPQTRGPVRGLPPGEWVDEGVYRISRRYRLGMPHGQHPLLSPDEMPVMRTFGATNRIVFLDLETTGLAGGTGTYAFLCGLGFVDGGDFLVVQFFLEGPAREARWLAAIDTAIPPDATLATYNGKAFDLPLLRTRHILARSTPIWDRFPHVDLLYLARRLYRGYLLSCSLGSMEKNVLGVTRSGEDIPGAMIPAIYFQYLRSSDASPLRGVFYHNELDIVSLAALYCHIASILDGNRGDGRERLRAGDIWNSQGRDDLSRQFWEDACNDGVSGVDARLRRAYRAKKSQDYDAARKDFAFVLNALIEGRMCTGEWVSVYTVCEELAKLEEHRFRSPDRAMEHVRSAFLWLKRNRHLLGHSYIQMLRDLQHRYERLNRKLERKESASRSECEGENEC